jgi:hypothetical protein
MGIFTFGGGPEVPRSPTVSPIFIGQRTNASTIIAACHHTITPRDVTLFQQRVVSIPHKINQEFGELT